MPGPNDDPQQPRCIATVWNTGRRCSEPAAESQPYCQGHVALIPPDEWAANGYALVLPAADQSLFRAARFADLSEEIALARLHLRAIAAQPGDANSQLLAALYAVAKLVKLRHDIDQTRFEHGPDYLRSKF